ncbi:competence protein TfoX [Clostridium botulinum A2 117]|uniref:TfoX/Sxy family protein n=1 Tax=Clostridium botulinum TaxID=1491 RepID=UPI0007E1F8A8|nr:TfoX/Sxy family protein [Clostridium botulinum]KEI77999.1 competence protein TfoX [Clostridium botulinum A2 117]MBN3415176.1 competence protein TfoX [Clostridium botulinum]MBN3441469.1 competence protein TfoX [Clostridium botulinum]MBY6805535.1 TfoX/Sxy family protein [Clostridium botulinum]
MASNIEFVEYVCDQISGAGDITYKKMFGDYGVYCNEKIIGLICDNQFFLKITKDGKDLLHEAIKAPAYKGAKPSFLIESLDNREYLAKIVSATYKDLPMPKPKKTKK